MYAHSDSLVDPSISCLISCELVDFYSARYSRRGRDGAIARRADASRASELIENRRAGAPQVDYGRRIVMSALQ